MEARYEMMPAPDHCQAKRLGVYVWPLVVEVGYVGPAAFVFLLNGKIGATL